ncbi:MAG: hypothetical protein ABIH23_32300 [bacterium]
MTKQSPLTKFIHTITKGLWVLPRRRREIRREILDHLEDLAEERQVSEWTTELLETEFGPAKQLKKLFQKGGLPLWARCLKWGIRGAAALFVLFLAADLGYLWFYPVSDGYIQIVQSNSLSSMMNLDIPKVDIKWLEEGDESAQRRLDTLDKCHAIVQNHFKRMEESRNSFLNKRRAELAAAGIIGATKQRMIHEYVNQVNQQRRDMLQRTQLGSSEETQWMIDMMNIQESECEEGFLFNTADPPYAAPKIPWEEFRRLRELWCSISSKDQIRIPRPTVTEQDVKEMEYALDPKTAMQPITSSPGGDDNLWRSTLITFVQARAHFAKETRSLKELIQQAKDYHALHKYWTQLDILIKVIAENIPGSTGRYIDEFNVEKANEITREEAAEMIHASALWCRLFVDAFDPTPEPIMAFLVLGGESEVVFEMIRHRIQSTSDIPLFVTALKESSKIDFEKAIHAWPEMPDVSVDNIFEMSLAKFFLVDLSKTTLFRTQCSVMQWFCRKGSDSYWRYEVLKRYLQIRLVAMAPDFYKNQKLRVNLARSKQTLAKTVLALNDWIEDNRSPSEFNPKELRISDPFNDSGPRFEIEDATYTVRTAGPRGTFDHVPYDPTNGTVSAGDLIWSLRRN